MANVNDIIKYFDLLCQKDYTGGFSPDEKNTALKQSEIMLWRSMVGLAKQSQGSQYPNNMFYEATEGNSVIIDNFKVGPLDLFLPLNGQLLRPSNLQYLSSVRHRAYQTDGTTKQVPVYPLTDGQASARLNSSIVPPTKSYPIMIEYDGYYQIFPKDLGNVVLTYLRLPIPAVWGFTLVNGEPVYDAATSTDSEFPDECIQDIALKMASILGISVKDQMVMNYAEQKQGTDL
jgi:hypothetical protein